MKLGLGLPSINKGKSFESNYSMSFDGTDDYVDLNNPFNYTTFSIAMWLKVTNVAGTRAFFDARDGGSDGVVLFCGSNDKVQFYVNGGNIVQTTAITGAWQFIGVTFDGSTAKLYSNAVTVQTASTSQTIATTTNARLGARSFTSPTLPHNGLIDEFATWNVVLDGNDMSEIYEAVDTDSKVLDLTKNTGGYDKSSSLLDYYRFEEGAGTTVQNLGSRGVAATPNGAVFSTDKPS